MRSASSVERTCLPVSFRCSDERSQSSLLSRSNCGTDQPRRTMAAWSCAAMDCTTDDQYSAQCASSRTMHTVAAHVVVRSCNG